MSSPSSTSPPPSAMPTSPSTTAAAARSSAALAYGTPQLLLPKGADQFWNADLMARAGLAEVIEPPHVTPDAVAGAAAAELGNLRPAVDAVSAEIAAMPDPTEVLEQLVSRIGWRSECLRRLTRTAPVRRQANEVRNRLS